MSFVSESDTAMDGFDGGAVLLFIKANGNHNGDLRGLGLYWDIGPEYMRTGTDMEIRRSDVSQQLRSCGVGLLPDGGF